MKRFILSALCCMVIGMLNARSNHEQTRQNKLFNFDWKFKAGETEKAQEIDFDDSKWRQLDLPHDFQMEQPWEQSAGGARGFKSLTTGWYRKSFNTDPRWSGKRVLLDFEGIMLWGEVWINGTKVLSIDYGYLGAETDITQHLLQDGKNVVAVYASTRGNSRWYTGGGLFRDVNLIVKDSISIARHGVFITTPQISPAKASVQVQVEVEGLRNRRLPIEIRARIFAPDGQLVAETKLPAPQGIKLQTMEVPLPPITVNKPLLWSCETPHLYTAEVSLHREGRKIDQITETFGIRTIEFSKEHGFKLNGEKVFLKGVSNHHDLGAIGAAVYDFAIERLFKQLKAFGYNHVRLSHNPYSKSFMRLADKHGILIVDELYDKWSERDYWPARKPFSQLWFHNIPEWIKRGRNHPSVILWSLGNELQMREDLAGFPTGDWGVTSYRILDVLVKRYDTTRPTTVAMFPARANAVNRRDADFNVNFTPPELSLVTEVASFNYQFHAYQKYLEHAPHLIIYQSEATTNELTAPFFGMDYDKMVGIAYWGAVAYWGESNGWPKKGWNFSFFNHALEPYPQAYLVKSAFMNEPLVHIGVVDQQAENLEWNDIMVGRQSLSSHWNRKQGSLQNLFTYSNADEVELLVNGKSLGVQKNNRTDIQRRNIQFWKQVPYGKGGNVTAIARNNGREVSRQRLETTGKAVALKVVTENSDWKANGMDLQYIRVYAIDSRGRIVPTTEGSVRFNVTGEAGLIAVTNGDHYTDMIFSEGNTVPFHNGFAMAILRSKQNAGEVQVNISSDGLRRSDLKLLTK